MVSRCGRYAIVFNGEIYNYRDLREELLREGLQLRTESDIDRIDFRPNKRVFKVRSKHDDLEVQVDAIGLKTWEPETRTSDWLERIHDGHFIGDWVHGWIMPLASTGFV